MKRLIVNEVLFLSELFAVVRFTLEADRGRFGPMEGRAVRVEEIWVIERGTFCELVGQVGVDCPPLATESPAHQY